MTEQPQNKKPLIIMSILGLLVMTVIAYVFTRPQASLMVTDLYQYYPENTAFYMELAPGESLTTRFVEGLDKLGKLENKGLGHSDVAMGEVLKKDFESQISLGSWIPTGQEEEAADNAEPKFLAVLPLKDGVTFETLAKDMKGDLNQFTQTQEGDATLLESKTPQHASLAIHQNNLLVANDTETLKAVLAERKTQPSVIDNPAFKPHLKLLPGKRQGTLLTHMAEFNKYADKNADDPTMEKISELQTEMQAATPVLLGSVTVKNDQYIQLNTFTPVDFSQIKDEALRKDMQALYQNQVAFNLPDILPKETVVYGGMTGLGQFYDLYVNHIADQEGKTSLESAKNQLKMVGLDLRKNVVSLFDGKSAVGVVAKKGMPEILLFLKHSDDTAKTMEQVGMMAAQMASGKVLDKKVDDSHSLKVIESPAIPVKVAYSNVQDDTLVLGTQTGVENVYSVQQKKSPSLKESALYKELAADMPAKVNGVFFVDFQQGASLMDDLAKQSRRTASQEKSFKEVLSGIEGMAGSNTTEGANMIKGQVTIKLATQK